MNPNSFPKTKRIIKGQRFSILLRQGSCAADDCLVVFAIARDNGDASCSRLGVTIPKKTGNAVARNRWKRWIREAFRTSQAEIPTGYDFVVRPKKGASGSWDAIRASLPRLARRAVKRCAGAAKRRPRD